MKFKTTTDDRKTVVKAVEEILQEKAKYQGPPTFSYIIGEFTVDRDGSIDCEDEERGTDMREQLAERGLAESDAPGLNVEVATPEQTLSGIRNLLNMIHSKQYLLEKALGTRAFFVSDALVDKINAKGLSMEELKKAIANDPPEGIEIGEKSITLSGFPTRNGDEYTRLASAIVNASLSQKRISADETIEENEKYYMRVWLVRLGLGGKEGKSVREVMLRNLKGHTAFRTEADAARWKEKYGKRGAAHE